MGATIRKAEAAGLSPITCDEADPYDKDAHDTCRVASLPRVRLELDRGKPGPVTLDTARDRHITAIRWSLYNE